MDITIINNSKKDINLWTGKERFCSNERLLINPYVGCSVNCKYCYSLNYPFKYFIEAKKQNKIFVFKNIVENIKKFLNRAKIAFTFYISGITDPLQPIDNQFNLTTTLIKLAKNFGINVSISTKSNFIKLKNYLDKNDFLQISINTLNPKFYKFLSPGSENLNFLLNNAISFSKFTNVIIRFDPIIPFFFNFSEIEKLFKIASQNNFYKLVFSIVDIPSNTYTTFIKELKKLNSNNADKLINNLEKQGRYFVAKKNIIEEIIKKTVKLSKTYNVNIGFCKEKYKGINANIYFNLGLCDGVKGVFKKNPLTNKFSLVKCQNNYNCLECSNPICGINFLALKNQKSKFIKKSWLL